MHSKQFEGLVFVARFYGVYALLFVASYALYDWPPVTQSLLVALLLYVVSMLSGNFVGALVGVAKETSGSIRINWLWLGWTILTVAIMLEWFMLIQFYGSIDVIMTNAFGIRSELIGQAEIQICPKPLTYASSLVYWFFAMLLAMRLRNRSRELLVMLCLTAADIFLLDLTVFGRVGVVYSTFMIFGYIFLESRREHGRVRKKKWKLYFAVIFLMGIVIMVPRAIRQAPDVVFGEGIYRNGDFRYEIPAVFAQAEAITHTMFASVFALGTKFDKDMNYTYGAYTFTPFARAYKRYYGESDAMYISRIEEDAPNLQREHNTYTIIWDFYSDFGVSGIVFMSFAFGAYIGYIFRRAGVMCDAEKMYMVGWLGFALFFSAFSFGSFVISWFAVMAFRIFLTSNLYANENLR